MPKIHDINDLFRRFVNFMADRFSEAEEMGDVTDEMTQSVPSRAYP